MAQVISALAWLGVLLCASPASAVPQYYGDISVEQAPEPDCSTWHGYAEYRFLVANRSAGKAHTVGLTTGFADRGRGGGMQVSRTVTVGAGKSATVSLYVPAIETGGAGWGVAVSVDGARQRNVLPVDFDKHCRVDRRPWFSSDEERGPLTILLSRAASQTLGKASSRRISLPEPEGFRFGDDTQSPVDAAPVPEWSTNWLGYSRFDAVGLTEVELSVAPPQVRSALMDYVRCGGSLLVVGAWTPPPQWQLASDSEGLKVYRAAFGQCLVASGTVSQSLLRDRLRETMNQSAAPFRDLVSVERAHQAVPVVDSLQVPVKGMLLLMLGFVVLIGPVNLAWLTRKGRRIWMLWTIPAFSLLTCGVVFAYSIFSEGFTGRYRTMAVTILDERAHQATTIGHTSFYYPIRPGAGLHFPQEMELTVSPRRNPDRYFYREDAAEGFRSIDWTRDQHLAGGWVASRIPVCVQFRTTLPQHEQLTVERQPDGQLAVVNALGAPIAELAVLEDGKIFRGRDIAPGARAVLTADAYPRSPATPTDTLRDVFAGHWLTHARRMAESPESFLTPGTYVAVLDGDPFGDAGLNSAKAVKCRTVVFGLREQP